MPDPATTPPEVPATATAAPAAPARRRLPWKLLVALLVVAVVELLLHYGPLKGMRASISDLKQYVGKAGAWGPCVFCLATALLTPVGVPRLILAGMAGGMFGFVAGFSASLGGTLLGAYLVFLSVRYLRRDWGVDTRRLADNRWGRLLDQPTVGTIFLLRQAPVHGLITNVLLGFSRSRHRDFLAGSLLGFVPQGAAAVLFGSLLGKTDWRVSALQFGAAGLAVAVSLWLVARVVRQDERKAGAKPPPA